MLKFRQFIDYNQPICPFCLEHYLRSVSVTNENVDLGNVSSLQIVVPTKGCINDCRSCIAKISNEFSFQNLSKNTNFESNYLQQMKKVRQTGCRDMVLTGIGEPLQNKRFLELIGRLNSQLENPFKIEIQTTGVLLENNIDLLKRIGVKVVSLSVFDIFDETNNLNIIGMKDTLRFSMKDLSSKIKSNFTYRISINLINVYDKHTVKDLFNRITILSPHQLTFRSMWSTNEDNPINLWIKSHTVSKNFMAELKTFLEKNSNKINDNKYIYKGISVYLNEDCMKENRTGGYVILRPDCQLYFTGIYGRY